MAFDGAFLWLIRHELARQIVGSRVDKVYQPTKNLLVLSLRSKDFAGKLMLSADPGGARLQLTTASIENPPVPPMLCMLLRKKLIGAKLTALRQPALERLVYLDFDTKNELGDPISLTLIAELMGRNANLILCDEAGKVIDAVRRTDASDTTRILMPGVTYMPPPANHPFDLTTEDPQSAVDALKTCQRRNLPKELLNAVPGISPIVGRELSYKAVNAAAEEDQPLSLAEQQRLNNQLQQLQQVLLQRQGVPTIVTDANGKMLDFTFFAPEQYGNSVTLTHCDSYSALLDTYYAKRDQKARMQAQSQSLNKWLNTTLARLARTVNVRTEELKQANNCEHLRKYGELIKANLGRIHAGDSLCRVIDYYDPDCGEIDIPLSPALSPAQNAQKYFKEYRKQCTAAGLLTGLIEQGKTDIAYLRSVQEALVRAETTQDVAAIQEELQEGGYLKQRNKGKKPAKIKALPPYEFLSDDGFVILAGRNNRQNDQLTLRQSAGNDIWFHTKNIPGSHVIVKADNREIPDTTLTQAAILAATLSGGVDGNGIGVDYCPVKRVKKPSGAAPGMVIYENYNTAYVDPDRTLLERLKKH